MHGRVKVRTTAEQEELKKIERAKKLEKYKAGIALVFQKRKDEIWDSELLLVSEKMLLQNPDIYTIWNIRREAFLKNNWNEEELNDLFTKELTLTEFCLRENPKSYSVWHHRCWVLDHIKIPDWERELNLCAQCLDKDERNFHCWDYRKYIVEKSNVSDEDEFEFSTSKILSNFSNYSSWHYRSKILSKMFGNTTNGSPIVEDKHKEELDLVMNATFTDPNDSSAWLYQRWLLDDFKSMPNPIWCILVNETSGVIIFNTNETLTQKNINLLVNGKEVECIWNTHKSQKCSKLWFTKFRSSIETIEDAEDVHLIFKTIKYKLSFSEIRQEWFFKSTIETQLVNHNESQLKEQLVNYKQLKNMEPNNKWTILTGVILMQKVDFAKYYENILEDLTTLTKIDPLRSCYYKDLHSKYVLRSKFNEIWTREGEHYIENRIDLSGLHLTTLCNNQYFAVFTEVNLGANNLANSLHLLHALQKCEKLSLSSNGIISLKTFPTLPCLKVLSLRNNKINSSIEVYNIINRHNLVQLNLKENPIYNDKELLNKISIIL